ncbi:MAG: tRNA-(ms[2]io[6]A)-hydroxylase [Myxococcota bacterium]
MLRLSSSSRDGWLNEALADLDAVLLDHAHCEKKAASMAVNFLFRYPEHAQMMAPLSALAREELRHFEQMLQTLTARGVPFARQHPSKYASQLVRGVRQQEPHRMMDLMLCAALIEARSCERMKILQSAFAPQGPSPDSALYRLYGGLLACEARHHHTYVDMALSAFPRDAVFERLEELSRHEAEIIAVGEPDARMHS